MEKPGLKEKLMGYVRKYRYVVLVCLIGVCLMMIPEKKEVQLQSKTEAPAAEEKQDTALLLAQILSKLQGAGKVEVMLTVAAGQQTIYQTDTQGSQGEAPGSVRVETVIVSTSARDQTGLITQVLPEKYLGAIVLCQGAENPAVRLAIVEAVCAVTGLGTDKISVLKMK